MYVIGVGGNRAAEYLAMKDTWYRRQVHAPFNDLSLLPHVSFDDIIRMMNFYCETSPVAQMRRLMLEVSR